MQISDDFYRQMAAHYIAADDKLRVADAIAQFCQYGIFFGVIPESQPERLKGFDGRESYWWIVAAISEYAERHGIVSNQQVANIMHIHRNTVWVATKAAQLRGWLTKIRHSSKGTTYEPMNTSEVPDFIKLIVKEIFDLTPDSPEVRRAMQNPLKLEWTADYQPVPLIKPRS